MSSRALRRLQREQEEQKQLDILQNDEVSEPNDEEDDGRHDVAHSANQSHQKTNAFDFLNSANDDENDDDAQIEQFSKHTKYTADHSDSSNDATKDSDGGGKVEPSLSKKKKGKKKKRKAGKGKTPQDPTSTPQNIKQQPELDEIDLALKSLEVKGKEASEHDNKPALDTGLIRLYELLATDSKYLNSLNEMKKLFGNIVLEPENEGTARPAAGRRGRRQELVDLGGALAGRNSPASRGQRLAGLVLRKNIFIPGKEDWPKATSGGLGMEIVERAEDFTTEYRFVHNRGYQSIQKQFDTCVESMDPERMIQLLQFNPYHISTLLQVAEIAKHQGDHSVSADLLERALFTFGRSVHSSFHIALSEGKARLDFRRPENREFWLAAWRYVTSLGKRGTWRTAYEWAKLLLSLDPEGDPYRIRIIIDQLAIRSGQFQNFIDLASTPTSVVDWGQGSPNIQMSLAMAHYKLKQAEVSRGVLSLAIKNYPWVFDRLVKELNIEHIKNSVWGKVPRTPFEELQTQTYAVRAKDIWNTPEALSLLVEVIETAELTDAPPPPTPEDVITINEARHIFLSEVSSLLSLLPRTFTTQRMSASDPLTPEDNLPSYGQALEDDEDEDEMDLNEHEEQALRQEAANGRSWLGRLLSRLGNPLRPSGSNGGPSEQQEEGRTQRDIPQDVAEVIQAMQNQGLAMRDLIDRGARFDWADEDRIAMEIPEEVVNDFPPQIRGMFNFPENDSEPEQEPMQDRSVPAVREEGNNQSSAQSPHVAVTSSQTAATIARESSNEPNAQIYDDEANQRWLAGRGMLSLKNFIAQHGSDETAWQNNTDIDTSPATEYAQRVTQLQKRASRDFILNYALKQGAGAEATDLIKRLLH